jgi:[ribosomal protein S5]-alanine N-acetyltransferase
VGHIPHIISRETGEVIGDIGFHGPPDETGTVEIGYGIVEQYRGRGLAGDSAVAICGLAWSRGELSPGGAVPAPTGAAAT